MSICSIAGTSPACSCKQSPQLITVVRSRASLWLYVAASACKAYDAAKHIEQVKGLVWLCQHHGKSWVSMQAERILHLQQLLCLLQEA